MCSCCLAEEIGFSNGGVKMIDFKDPSDYANVLNCVAEAISDQNVSEYSKHFLNFNKKNRKSIAIFFISCEPTAVLVENHLIDSSENQVEVAVNYTISYDSTQHNFNSIVLMKKINSEWKISGERVLSKSSNKTNQKSENIFGCANGVCPLNK
jgi:hypothetical protein